jgi:hypothetical protein
MIILKIKNVKNLHLLIGFIFGLILIISGAILKIDHSSYANSIIILGLIIKIQVILMVIYKYGYLLRK